MDGNLNDVLIHLQDDVRQHFGWDHQDDAKSALALLAACEMHPNAEAYGWSRPARAATLERVREVFTKADLVVLVGAAAQRRDLDRSWPAGTVFVAADGAVGACLDLVKPVCVVTDLDGGEHLDAAVAAGIPLFVHAHGDNLSTWARLLKKWESNPPPLVLTHQCRDAVGGMLNPGGFTDGDRAACLIRWLGVEEDKMLFVGFSTDRVGPWSGTTDPVRKLEKLVWMATVLDLACPKWRTVRKEAQGSDSTRDFETQA